MNRIHASRKGLGALHLILVLIVVFAGSFFLYRNWQAGVPSKKAALDAPSVPAPGTPGSRTVPPFSLKDSNGNVYTSSQFAGKPTVINFFATWCAPCRDEIPGFVAVYKKHKGKGLELIGISLDADSRKEMARFMVNHEIDYRILFGDLATARAYGGVTSLPTTFFVGKDGEIKNVHVGYLDKDDFDREVQKLM